MMKFKGEICLLIVALIWGSGFVASDLALGALTATQVMAIRFTVAALVLGSVFRRRLREPGRLDRPTIRRGVVLGIFLGLSFLAQTVGLVFTTPSKNAFLTAVNVILVPFIGAILTRSRGQIERSGIAGATLAILGVGLISWNGSGRLNLGDGLTLLCAIGFAFHIYFTGDFLLKGSDAAALTVVQLATAAALSMLAAVAEYGLGLGQLKSSVSVAWPGSLLAAVYLGIFATAVAFLLQTVAQQWTTQSRAAILMSTEAVFGTLLSALILHEHLTRRSLIGSTLVFAAILIAETGAASQPLREPRQPGSDVTATATSVNLLPNPENEL